LATAQVAKAAADEFGSDSVRFVPTERQASGPLEFPVEIDGRLFDAGTQSEVLVQIPPIHADYVYIDPQLLESGRRWLDKGKDKIIAVPGEKE